MKIYWFLFLLCPLLNAITGNMIFNVIFMVLGCCSFILLKRINIYIIISCVFISSLIIVVQYLSSMDNIFRYVLYFLSSFISSYVFFKSKIYLTFKVESIILFLILLLYISYYILIGADLNGSDVFKSLSRNYISIYSLFYIIILCICNAENNKTIAFFSILNLLMILFTFSRSGILTSSMLIFSLLYKDGFNVRKKAFFVVVSLLLIMIVISHSDVSNIILERISRQGFGDTGRQDILSCYYNNFDLSNFLFGLNYNGDSYCGTLGVGSYSLHNSFLSLYSFLGITSICVFFIILKTIFNFKNKKQTYFALLYIILLLRASTDSVLFFSPIDFAFWLLFFYSYSKIECSLENEKRHI